MVFTRSIALAQPILKRDEERRLIAAWKSAACPDAFERMTLAYMRVCFNVASYYSSNPEHVRDLAQEGVFGIRRALDEYDPSYGTLFSTFVRRYIKNAIADKVSAVSTDVSIPSRVLLDARAGRITRDGAPAAFAVLTAPMLLDAPAHPDSGSVADLFPDTSPSPEELVSRVSDESYYRKLVKASLVGLSSREREIVSRRHLTDPADTLEQIGRDLGITRERVRQLEVASMAKIRRYVSRVVDKNNLFS